MDKDKEEIIKVIGSSVQIRVKRVDKVMISKLRCIAVARCPNRYVLNNTLYIVGKRNIIEIRCKDNCYIFEQYTDTNDWLTVDGIGHILRIETDYLHGAIRLVFTHLGYLYIFVAKVDNLVQSNNTCEVLRAFDRGL